MTESIRTAVNKDIIDGSKVVHREMARIFTPMSKQPDGLSPTYGVDRCVLEDARVVFQCVHPDPPFDCEYWHTAGVSVRSHLRVHVQATEKAKQARITAERDALVLREAQRKTNYKNGAIKAAATKRENRAGNELHNENGNEGTPVAAKHVQKKIDNAQTALEGAAEGLDRVETVLTNIRKTVENAVQTLEELGQMQQEVDPAIMAKANKWDALQGLMGGDARKSR